MYYRTLFEFDKGTIVELCPEDVRQIKSIGIRRTLTEYPLVVVGQLVTYAGNISVLAVPFLLPEPHRARYGLYIDPSTRAREAMPEYVQFMKQVNGVA